MNLRLYPGKFAGKLAALLRCGSCRFAALYVVCFYAGLLKSGHFDWRWALFGALYWSLFSLGTELLNRHSDRVEDEINRPERTALCKIVGFDRILLISVLVWVLILLADIALIALFPGWLLAGLLVLAFLFSVNYSYGFRLKRYRYASLFVLTFPFGGTFLTGWSVYLPWSAAATAVEPLVKMGSFLLLGGLFMLSMAGVKDVTDIAGDERIGYRSLWGSYLRHYSTGVIIGLVSVPFMTLSAFVAVGVMPTRFFLLLMFWPVTLVLAYCVKIASRHEERDAVRELLYHLLFAFLSVEIYLFAPMESTVFIVIGTGVYWIMTSQFLHWNSGMRAWMYRALFDMLRQRTGESAAT